VHTAIAPQRAVKRSGLIKTNTVAESDWFIS
jgi:hypothetical protein